MIRYLQFLLFLLLAYNHDEANAFWWDCGGDTDTEPPTPAPAVQPPAPTTPGATPAPTSVPTPAPTSVPTPVPTSVPTPLPTSVPTPVPTSAPTPSPTSVPTPAPTLDNDIFAIVVMSDMEHKWRGHSTDRSRYVAEYIKNVKSLNLFFDDEYSAYPIDPQLIINTGDVSHYWACHNPSFLFRSGSCRTPDDEFVDIWQQLYDAGIPMISAYGNHDWKPRLGTGNYYTGKTPGKDRDEETDNINTWSSEFVQKTYETSAAMGEIEFEAIAPTGDIGQNMYKSSFRGLQIASFNSAYNWQSYDDSGIFSADDQFLELANSLDQSKPTLFFSHFPLSSTRLDGQTPTRENAISLIQQFPESTHHFAGHYHAAVIERYEGFNDYIVPYPHTWGNREPGYLAVLVSAEKGVLQVKPMTIPGLEDGTVCIPANVMAIRNFVTPSRLRPSRTFLDNWLGYERSGNGCDRCKAGKQYWSTGDLGWICGEEPSEDNGVVNEELPLDSLDETLFDYDE